MQQRAIQEYRLYDGTVAGNSYLTQAFLPVNQVLARLKVDSRSPLKPQLLAHLGDIDPATVVGGAALLDRLRDAVLAMDPSIRLPRVRSLLMEGKISHGVDYGVRVYIDGDYRLAFSDTSPGTLGLVPGTSTPFDAEANLVKIQANLDSLSLLGFGVDVQYWNPLARMGQGDWLRLQKIDLLDGSRLSGIHARVFLRLTADTPAYELIHGSGERFRPFAAHLDGFGLSNDHTDFDLGGDVPDWLLDGLNHLASHVYGGLNFYQAIANKILGNAERSATHEDRHFGPVLDIPFQAVWGKEFQVPAAEEVPVQWGSFFDIVAGANSVRALHWRCDSGPSHFPAAGATGIAEDILGRAGTPPAGMGGVLRRALAAPSRSSLPPPVFAPGGPGHIPPGPEPKAPIPDTIPGRLLLGYVLNLSVPTLQFRFLHAHAGLELSASLAGADVASNYPPLSGTSTFVVRMHSSQVQPKVDFSAGPTPRLLLAKVPLELSVAAAGATPLILTASFGAGLRPVYMKSEPCAAGREDTLLALVENLLCLSNAGLFSLTGDVGQLLRTLLHAHPIALEPDGTIGGLELVVVDPGNFPGPGPLPALLADVLPRVLATMVPPPVLFDLFHLVPMEYRGTTPQPNDEFPKVGAAEGWMTWIVPIVLPQGAATPAPRPGPRQPRPAPRHR